MRLVPLLPDFWELVFIALHSLKHLVKEFNGNLRFSFKRRMSFKRKVERFVRMIRVPSRVPAFASAHLLLLLLHPLRVLLLTAASALYEDVLLEHVLIEKLEVVVHIWELIIDEKLAQDDRQK